MQKSTNSSMMKYTANGDYIKSQNIYEPFTDFGVNASAISILDIVDTIANSQSNSDAVTNLQSISDAVTNLRSNSDRVVTTDITHNDLI